VAVTETPAHGQIRNSNGPLLLAAAARAGAEAMELGIARDEPDDLRHCIEHGLEADVLILSGGVSAGKFDLIPEALKELGVEQVFHKLALKPGKPLWFGVKREGNRSVLVFGLPGNPVSSFVCFELFVRPAVAKMSGRGFKTLPVIQARLVHGIDHAGGRAAYVPAEVQPSLAPGGWTASLLPWQGSADLASLARANGLVRFSTEKRRYAAGEPVDVIRI
jgi:molybdopterin molybdotransferase